MKKFFICFFAASLLIGCGKTELSKQKKKNNDLIEAELSKTLNKFNVAEINSSELFSLLVIERGKRSAVLFYSNESVPAVQTRAYFADMAQERSNVILFAQVNLSDKSAEAIGVKYNIFFVPTLVLFNHGVEFNRLVGKNNIKNFKFTIRK